MKKITLLVLSIAMIFAGCKKDKNDDATPSTNNLTVNSTPQVSFKLDGTTTTVLSGSTIAQSVGSSGSQAVPPDSSTASYSCSFDMINPFTQIFGVEKGCLHYYGFSVDTVTYSNFFKPGTFGFVNDPDVQSGFRITYFINGVKWSTEQGSGNQSGSVFKIEDRKTWNSLGQTGVIILGTFNCKLYDGAGNSKTITDGVIVSSFENF